MLEEILWYHTATINLFLLTIIISLILPTLYYNRAYILVKWSKIYSFVYYGLISMVAFDGMIMLIVAKRDMGINIILMIIAFIVLIMLEIYKSIELKKYIQSIDTFEARFRKVFVFVASFEILIIFSFLLIYSH